MAILGVVRASCNLEAIPAPRILCAHQSSAGHRHRCDGCLECRLAARGILEQKDPQRVVIDEVSGQHLTLLLGVAVPSGGSTSIPTQSDFHGRLDSDHPPLTGNICCWVLYFFVCSIFGSRFRRGRRNRCRAAGESWRMIGSQEFTRRSDCGSRERRAFDSNAPEEADPRTAPAPL